MIEEKLFTAREAAEYLGLSEQTLANWRHQRKGPTYIKVGERAIRYRGSSLDRFLNAGKIKLSA